MRNLLRCVVAVPAVIAALLFGSGAAQAAVWSGNHEVSDCAGNACLTMDYATDLSAGDGMKLSRVKIAAASSSSGNYQGTSSKGLSCWNDRNVIKWSKSDVETSLNAGQVKTWTPDQIWAGSESITCGYYFTDDFIIGGAQNQCAKVKGTHDNGNVGTACASGKLIRHRQPVFHFNLR